FEILCYTVSCSEHTLGCLRISVTGKNKKLRNDLVYIKILNLLTSTRNAGNTGKNYFKSTLECIANELYRPARKVFPRHSIIRFQDDLWQSDLMDIQFHSKQNFVFIDKICMDNGTEFYNNQFQELMKKYKIRHYSTYSVIKCSIGELKRVERRP
ncbi:TRPL translocation defect protein 14-like, partial [Aphis craccivora]